MLSQVSEFLANRIFAEIEICESEYGHTLWCPTQKEWHVEIDEKNHVSFIENDFVFSVISWDEFHDLILTLGEIMSDKEQIKKMPLVTFPVKQENIAGIVLELSSYRKWLHSEARSAEIVLDAIKKMCDHSGMKGSNCTCGYSTNSGDPFL